MNIPVYLFASTRYWPDQIRLNSVAQAMAAALANVSASVQLVVDGDLSSLPEHLDAAVIIPLSGSVQRPILSLAQRCATAILYAGYCAGNFDEEITEQLLQSNAAPTLMDTWAVLNRQPGQAFLAVTQAELADMLQALQAVQAIRGSKLLLIGETEPWVVSNAEELTAYEKALDITIEHVSPEEMIRRYGQTTAEAAAPMLDYFTRQAASILEPTAADLQAACRFGTALKDLLEAREACGAAIACFDLIRRTGINACLGAAYINDTTNRFITCEGDMDSAATMLLLRQLTSSRLWMANPCLDGSGRVNFSHCTAPCSLGKVQGCVLRNHHETGIGVSVDVPIGPGEPLTLCRISRDCSAISIHTGHTVPGKRLHVCRTQVWVALDNYPHYLETALGCHQVFAFEKIESRVRMAARLLHLTIV